MKHKELTARVLTVMERAGQPMGHYGIAHKLAESPWEICVTLHGLKKRGLVRQLKKSRRGPNPPDSLWEVAL